MGRETKILLALLGLLVGVFMGVVALKLFVPRPPEGAGPDVHGNLAELETQPLVEPPELDRLPPIRDSEPAAPDPFAVREPAAPDPYAARTSRFSQPVAIDEIEPPVQPASFLAAEPLAELPLADAPADLLTPPSELVQPGTTPAAEPPVSLPPRAAPPTADVPTGSEYLARPGDSWWSLAERAYGDGRLYRALFAWNRRLDPRVSLQPGTRLEIPSPDRLAAAWPTLMPRD